MLTAELKVIGGRQNGKLLTLPKKFLIGREQDCHLRPNSDLVSRHHCAFTLDGYTLRLRDLGSTNGTYLNGELLEGEVMLKQGDHVRVGKLEFEIQLREVADAEVASDQQFLPEEDSRILAPEDMNQSSSETMVDMRIPTEPVDEFATSDTGTIPVYDPQSQYPPMPGYYPQMPPGYYPPQGMPGYPMPPGYNPYYMPPQPMPLQAPPTPPPPSGSSTTPIPAVRLPDPKETGVKAPPAPPASAAGGGDKKEKDSTNAAADLLNKMRERR